MSNVSHFRDEALGAALVALELPEHEPTFFAELETRLRVARPRRFHIPTWPSARLLAGAAITAATVVLVIVALPWVRGTETARAAEIEARVTAAIADARSARGRLTYTALDARTGRRTTTRQSFVLDASGDQRLTDLFANTASAYDAGRGVERAITTSASIGSGRFYAERVGLAPGAPDAGPSDSPLDAQLGAVTRALAAVGDDRVREVDFDGHPAWQLDVAPAPNTIYPDVDHLSITVDRRSGFPVHVLATLDGQFRSELRLDGLELNAPLAPDVFSLRFPAGAEILNTNAGFSNVDLKRAAELVGYRPLVPRRAPGGFRLVTVAAARVAAATGRAQSNPPSRDVVSLSYRRGLEQIVVTTRRRGLGRWSDPFAAVGVPLRGDRIRLHDGALDGTTAEVVVDPRAVPHLWAVSDRLVVTVAGDLSRAELIDLAEALRS